MMESEIREMDMIRRYLEGTMEKEELRGFEGRLQAEPELQEAVEMERAADHAIRIQDEIQVRKKLQEMHAQMLDRQRRRRVMLRRNFSIAASILLVLVPSIYFIFFQQNTNEGLFDSFFEVEKVPDRITQKGPGVTEQLILAMKNFQRKDYTKAIEIFNDVPDSSTRKMDARFYSGISHLALKQGGLAEAEFLAIVSQGRSELTTDAKWFLGLSYLLLNRKEEAIKLFKEIAGQIPKAKSILEELEN